MAVPNHLFEKEGVECDSIEGPCSGPHQGLVCIIGSSIILPHVAPSGLRFSPYSGPILRYRQFCNIEEPHPVNQSPGVEVSDPQK